VHDRRSIGEDRNNVVRLRASIAHGKPPCDHNCAPDAAASTASHPNVRDDGQRPSEGRDGENKEVIWVKRKQEYFCKGDWTGQISLKPLQKIAWVRRSTSRGLRRLDG
jgi:hypothetical protein